MCTSQEGDASSGTPESTVTNSRYYRSCVWYKTLHSFTSSSLPREWTGHAEYEQNEFIFLLVLLKKLHEATEVKWEPVSSFQLKTSNQDSSTM
jgi:hypothetical protein